MVSLSGKAVDHMVRLIEDRPTEEVGGFLLGLPDWVEMALGVQNVASDPTEAFEAAPAAMAAAAELADEKGWEILGTFHSHPKGPPTMSRADVALGRNVGLVLIVATETQPWKWRIWDPRSRGAADFTTRRAVN